MDVAVVGPPTPQSPVRPDTLSSVTAAARFEFEPGRANEGSKVLMVEWQDGEHEARGRGSYHVSWPGMRTVFPAHDRPADNIQRVFYLIPPGQAIPPHVTLAYRPPPATDGPQGETAGCAEPQTKTFQPLPAIFTDELGAKATASGRKGVLHTLWAKRRLQVLNAEIAAEQAKNVEGVALAMALDERRFIEDNFGLSTTSSLPPPPPPPQLQPNSPPQTPKSARSAGGAGRRLSEKLRGLSLGTTDDDLKARPNTFIHDLHPLSSEVSDVAHSAFHSFDKRTALPGDAPPAGRRVVAPEPPESIKRQQREAVPLIASSINFQQQPTPNDSDDKNKNNTDGDNDDLFAVAIGPRSPDIPKSPFSFSSDRSTRRKESTTGSQSTTGTDAPG